MGTPPKKGSGKAKTIHTLAEAAKEGDLDMVKVLIESGADVDKATDMAFAAMPVLRFADRANHWLTRPARPAAFELELARQLLNFRAEASAAATVPQA